MRKDPSDREKIYLDQATSKLFRIDVDKFRSDGKCLKMVKQLLLILIYKNICHHCTKDE